MPQVDNASQIKLKADPRAEPDFEVEDVHALQAVEHGRASEEQQRRAMEFIVKVVCGTYDMMFRPSDVYSTHVAEGKRIAGLHIVTLLKTKLKITGEHG